MASPPSSPKRLVAAYCEPQHGGKSQMPVESEAQVTMRWQKETDSDLIGKEGLEILAPNETVHDTLLHLLRILQCGQPGSKLVIYA